MDYKKINLKWTDIESATKDIYRKIVNFQNFNGYSFDCIICVGRGGMVPSRILSEYLNIDKVYMINCKSYNGTTAGKVIIEQLNKNINDMNVLVVDDCMATGGTFSAVVNEISKFYKIKNLRSCCLYASKSLSQKPSFFFKEYNSNTEWLVFPWERKPNGKHD